VATILQIDVKDDGMQAKLNALIAQMSDLSPIMSGIANELVAQTEKNVAAGGLPKWHPLATSTIKERTRRGTWPGQILQDSGQLAASITPSSGSDFAQISTNKTYAAIHQYGGVIHHNAYSLIKHLRTNAKGELERQGKDGKLKNLAVFAKEKHKRVKKVIAEHPEHDTLMPARPFLPITPDGKLTPSALDAVMKILDLKLGL
jgi:phage virion morphogenesis protein